MELHVRRGQVVAWACAAAIVAGMLTLPGTAFAQAASFSLKKPSVNATTTVATPTVSVYVVDRYGVKGTTNLRLYIDGNRRYPKIAYRSRYKRFTLSYKVVSALKPGSHTIVFQVKNIRRQWSTVTWKFKVAAPTPPTPSAGPMPITIQSTDCLSCHPGYPAAHPMTNCPACHGTGRPISGQAYTSASNSAHTLACATSPCHQVATVFPHVLSSDCASCHNGAFSDIPPVSHPSDPTPSHLSTSRVCTAAGCHQASLTTEHYRYSIAGVRLSCSTCHASRNAAVLSALRTGSTACEGCHALTSAHAASVTAHTIPTASPCLLSGCHSGTAITIHSATGGPGCAACHAVGRTPSTDCTTCHDVTGATHAGATVSHTAIPGTCISALCHLSDVSAIHGKTGGPGCAACHAAGKTPTVVCTVCHTGTFESLHPRAVTAHTTAGGGCVSTACHVTDVSAIHAVTGGPGCAACHAASVTPTLYCSTCHPGDLTARHATASAGRHAATNALCINSTCHVSDVATIHAAGRGCVDCHAPGKTASLTCSNCHPSTVALAHPEANTAHTAPASTCVSSACHTSNVTTLHTALASQGCPTCHQAGTAPTLDCTVCHTSGLAARHTGADLKHTAPASTCVQANCHAANIALLHGALATSGCPTCHAPGKTLTQNCTVCHVGDLTLRHTAATAAHTAPIGSCVTGGCHETNVSTIHGRIGGPGCAACHAIGKTPSLTCTATGCHVVGTTLHSGADVAHAAPASTCVQSACHLTDVSSIHSKTGCVACHAVGKTPSLVCSNCHPGDLTPRHSFADSLHLVVDPTCLGSSCHVTNAATIHAAGLGCVDCHGVGKTPSLVCGTCHAGTLLTLHPRAVTSHTAPATVCSGSTCHGTDVTATHTLSGVAKCTACHGTGQTPGTNCLASGCHPGGLTAHSLPTNTKHVAAAGTCVKSNCHAADVTALHAPAAGKGCAICHVIGRTATLNCATTGCHSTDYTTVHPNLTSSHTGTYASCVKANCHVADVAAVHVVAGVTKCAACHATGITPSVNCPTCHSTTYTTVHPNLASSHTGTYASCVSAGCHVADVSAVHVVAGVTKCAACHATGITPSVNCPACHSTNYTTVHPNIGTSHTGTYASCVSSTCHAADVSTVHVVAGVSKCAACHATGVTPSVNCPACHSTSYTTVHPNLSTLHHGTYRYCVTTGCHVADVASIHVVGGVSKCAACHATGVTASVSCPVCHSADPNVNHAPAAASHTAPTGTCVQTGCHVTDVSSIHVVSGVSKCTACHATGVTPSVICGTTGCHTGDVSMVHAAAIGTKHTVVAGSCQATVCHGNDAAALHPVTGCAACHAPTKTPSLVCTSCHDADIVTLHTSGTLGHSVNQHPCTDAACHGTNAAVTHAQTISSCMACHTNADGTADSNACYGTYGCHDLAWASRHGGAAIATDFHGGGVGNGDSDWGWWSDGWIKAPYSRGMNLPCSTCHVQAGTSNIYDFPLVLNGTPINVTDNHTQLQTVCEACHGGTVNQWHAGCISCHDGGMGSGAITDFTGQDCSRCHQHGMPSWPHSIWSFSGPTM